jgi:hypothetical protein
MRECLMYVRVNKDSRPLGFDPLDFSLGEGSMASGTAFLLCSPTLRFA